MPVAKLPQPIDLGQVVIGCSSSSGQPPYDFTLRPTTAQRRKLNGALGDGGYRYVARIVLEEVET